MYRDRSLIPSEAVRLAALGSLALEPKRYADLVAELRQFTARIAGPSLDLVGPPIELLRVEGLIEAVEGEGPAGEAPMRVTPAGRAEFVRLMGAALRPSVNDLNKLVLALKLRFLHLLGEEEQRMQAEAMVEMAEQELARLQDLERRRGGEGGLLPRWLTHEIGQAEARLAWFRALFAEMTAEA
jgi:DNA-binding PadR family transcriptional regulator